tara:strand:- start:23 stop:355 length:333 start_codon:yes stop_codon:yes gene_type:complete
MAELTINQLIKIIIGIFVVVVVVGGLYLFFSNYVVDFFKNLPGEEENQENSVSVSGDGETKVEEEVPKKSLDNCKKCKEWGWLDLCSEKECKNLGKNCKFVKGEVQDDCI